MGSIRIELEESHRNVLFCHIQNERFFLIRFFLYFVWIDHKARFHTNDIKIVRIRMSHEGIFEKVLYSCTYSYSIMIHEIDIVNLQYAPGTA